MTRSRISERPAAVAAAIHRKLRAIAAVLLDPAATEHEKANAASLKISLERKLEPGPTPESAWPGLMFRLGRTVREIKQSTSSSARQSDWPDHAFRLGRALRRGWKK
jgi:hypothetical protein